MVAETLTRGGIGQEWLDMFLADGGDRRLAQALGIPYPPSGADEAALAVANDMGLTVADIAALESPAPRKGAGNTTEAAMLAHQWQFAPAGEVSIPTLVLPVGIDHSRSAWAPGNVPLSLTRLGDDLFVDSICDLVALPLAGGRPMSLTGLSLAVGRFAVRERGEVELFAGAMTWLNSYLARAREMEGEYPALLVPKWLDAPDHYSTLLLEPTAVEWRPQMAWCALAPETKSLIVRDSAGLAALIDSLMRRKQPQPPLPKIYAPKAGVA